MQPRMLELLQLGWSLQLGMLELLHLKHGWPPQPQMLELPHLKLGGPPPPRMLELVHSIGHRDAELLLEGGPVLVRRGDPRPELSDALVDVLHQLWALQLHMFRHLLPLLAQAPQLLV